jgi:hypothetical protein
MSPEATELVHHAQLSAQENACEEFSDNTNPMWGVHHLAATSHIQTLMLRVQGCQIKLFELHFHIPKQFYFVVSYLKIIGNGNPGSNSESHCTTL